MALHCAGLGMAESFHEYRSTPAFYRSLGGGFPRLTHDSEEKQTMESECLSHGTKWFPLPVSLGWWLTSDKTRQSVFINTYVFLLMWKPHPERCMNNYLQSKAPEWLCVFGKQIHFWPFQSLISWAPEAAGRPAGNWAEASPRLRYLSIFSAAAAEKPSNHSCPQA